MRNRDPVQIGPSEILIAATDGLVEQRNNAGKVFEEVVLSMQPATALSAGGALTDLLDRGYFAVAVRCPTTSRSSPSGSYRTRREPRCQAI